MSHITEWLTLLTGFRQVLVSRLLSSLLILLVLYVVRWVALRIVMKQTEDIVIRYNWRKYSHYIIIFLSIILVGRVWSEGVTSLATYLGLLSAGIAIALKDPLTNFAGWVFILFRKPFEVGDRIQIGSLSGDVIDVRIFQFTLMEIGNWVQADQSTGRIIHIPNGKIFTEAQANYSKGFQYIWNEIPVLVTFESNWQSAKTILQSIADKHSEHLSSIAEEKVKEASKKFMIFYNTLTPIIYTSVKDSGVLLTMRYLTEPRRRRNSEHVIWEDVLQEFGKYPDIEFAYPTQRFFRTQTDK